MNSSGIIGRIIRRGSTRLQWRCPSRAWYQALEPRHPWAEILIHSCIIPFRVYTEPACIFKTLAIPTQKPSAVLKYKHQEAGRPHPQTRNQNEVPQLHAVRIFHVRHIRMLSWQSSSMSLKTCLKMWSSLWTGSLARLLGLDLLCSYTIDLGLCSSLLLASAELAHRNIGENK